MGMDEAVQAYYDSFGEHEWDRLARPDDGAIEWAVTRHVLDTFLPAGARVLDLGGGPGRYALWLAERGHRVTLADLSPALIALACEKIAASPVGMRVEEALVADARDLSRWADHTFDAALALGPFYHLPQASDRDQAAQELTRVIRPAGVVFVALMPRYAFLRRTLAIPDERRHLASSAFTARVLEDGVFENDIAGRFTGGYGARPQEIIPFFAQHGFTVQTLLAVESIVPDLQEALAALARDHPDAYERMMEIIMHAAADPSILGLANHLLYVGVKG